MRPMSSRVTVAILSSAAVAGGFFGGAAFLNHVQFAQAETKVDVSRQQLANVEDLSTVFREVAKVVEPSVVRIDVTKTINVPAMNMPDQDFLRRFFQDNGQQLPDAPDNGGGGGGGGGQQDEEGTGSGVIMDAQNGYGYILTNNHVAGGADDIKVTLTDGRVIDHCHLMGNDPKSDIAVVRIKADDLITASWGNSDDLQQGDWVLAFGCPLGYAGTMTHGIVSALSRDKVGVIQGDYAEENFIQVDAPINPGNSGGPLVNLHGDVVGVNTAIASRTGEFNGIGLAIPSNEAHRVYDTLKNGRKMVRGWLGVGINDVADYPHAKELFGYSGKEGVLVNYLLPGSPASGKIKEEDIITGIDGHPVNTDEQLRNFVASTSPGTTVKFTLVRDGQTMEVPVTLGAQPDAVAAADEPAATGRPRALRQIQEQNLAKLGLQITTMSDELARPLGYEAGTKGALVTNVKAGSVADKSGMAVPEVIVRVGNTDVTDAASAAEALSNADLNAGVKIKVLVAPHAADFVFLQNQVDEPSSN